MRSPQRVLVVAVAQPVEVRVRQAAENGDEVSFRQEAQWACRRGLQRSGVDIIVDGTSLECRQTFARMQKPTGADTVAQLFDT